MKVSCTNHSNHSRSNVSQVLRKLALPLVLCCLFNVSNALAQYTDIKRLGTSQAICKNPGVQTRAELQKFFTDNPTIITKLLRDAKWQGDPQELFNAIAAGEFTEKRYRPGTKFEWMGMREKGQPKAFMLRRWAGEEAFSGYEAIVVVQGCDSYQFVIPKVCCNLALSDITIVSEQPRLNVVVEGTSMRICTDQNASVTLKGPDGASNGLSLDQDECWQGFDMAPGDYSITAVGECGRTERTTTIAGAPVAALAEDAKPSEALKLIPFIAGVAGTETVMRLETAWDMEMRDSSGIVGARAGLKVPLNRRLFFVPSLGVLHRTGVNEGNVYPDDSVNVDVGFEQFITNKFFIGAGIGAWNVDDSDFREGSVFINMGGPITKSTEWFAEARGIDSDNPDGNDGFSDNRSFSAGFRLLFD